MANKTDITTGAAANASVINAPDSQIDAALGTISGLSTTTKSSAVAAINEIYTRVAGSIDADGTLKAGAVDGAGVLASDVVTAAKILDGALPSANLVVDAFNQTYTPTTQKQDGYTRWWNSQYATMVDPDTSNPFGCPSVRMSGSNYAGRKTWLIEAGLKVGDVISAGVYAYIPTSTNPKFAVTFRDVDNNVIGSSNVSSAYTGADSAQLMVYNNLTIPAGCVSIDIDPSHNTGSGNVDVYQWIIIKGTQIFAGTVALTTADGALALNLFRKDTSPNLAFDPFNRYYSPSASAQDGQVRWLYPSNLSVVDPDSNNPFGLPTIRMGTTVVGGRRFFVEEMGIQVGDIVSVGFLCLVPTGRSIKVGIAARDSGGSVIYNTSGLTWTGDSTVQLLHLDAQTVPATTVEIDVWPVQATGTGNVDVYGWYIVKGGALMTTKMAESLSDGQRSMKWLQDAKGTMASLNSRLSVSLNDDGTLISGVEAQGADYINRHLLRSWQSKAATLLEGDAAIASILLLGDSWVSQTAIRLTSVLQTAYGDSGAGYQSLGLYSSGSAHGTTYTVTGTWADSDAEATSKGIHAGHTTSTDTATPGKVVATALMNAVVIHYLKQVDGGTFRYRIDSGSWTSVDTSNAGDLYATETVSGLDGSSHTLTIEVTVAGSAGVTLMGIEPQLTADGVRTHFGGNGGTQALHFSQLNATLFQDGITALDPDLVIIILGTNDCVNDVTIANFETRYNTVIDRIQAAVPLADIVLVCPAADYLEGTYPMSDYQASIRSMAVSQGCACLDLYMDFGPYNDAVTRGIMVTADVHPTDAGYRLIVNLLLNRLLNMGE